jgi:hypothetical protein
MDKGTITSYLDLSMVAGGTKCPDNVCRCNVPHSNPLLPHFVKIEYMGRYTTSEIVRALYEAFHTRDEPLTVRRPELIKSAVSRDMFRVGIYPGLHLRSLVLRIKLDRLRKQFQPHVPTSVCQHSQAEKIYTERDELQSWLKALLYIKYKAKFELHVTLFQRNVRVAVMEEVLTSLGDIRQALLDRHAEVSVDWTYHGHWSRGKNQDTEDSVCVDMDGFFYLPRKAWKMDTMQFLIMVSISLGCGLFF